MSTYIMISEPIRKRWCHQCRKEIQGEHLRAIISSGSVSKYVNICRECLTMFAEILNRKGG